MKTLKIQFIGQSQVEVVNSEVASPQAGEVLVKARKSLISTGTECIVLGRKFAPGTHWDNWVNYPFIPGYLSAGEVIEVGEGVTQFKVGDRVACRGPHHQFYLSAVGSILPIPAGVSEEDAAWYGLAKITQNGVRKAEHQMGDSVVIIGLGLLGQLVTQYVRLLGARQIIAIDISPMRLEMAKAHGATHTLQLGVEEAKAAISEITEGRLADVVYDVTGHAPVFSHALGLARRFGKVLLLGDAGAPSEQRLTHDVITRGVKIVGAHDVDAPHEVSDYAYWTGNNMGKLFMTYLDRGQMKVSDLVTHRFSPLEAPKAYHLLETDRSNVMGVVFDWTGL